MRLLAFIVLSSSLLVASAHAQRRTRVAPPQTQTISVETRYNAALAGTDEEMRLSSLLELLQQNEADALAPRIRESIVSTRAALADRRLREGLPESAFKLFMEAIDEAPEPVSDELFAKVLLQIPTNLFVAGRRSEAFDAASAIERKIGYDSRKLVGLTTFFITVQYGTEAIRLAEKAVELDSSSTLPRFTLATAFRLNFRLADAITVYRGILEIDGGNSNATLALADLLRATGKFREAADQYRLLLEQDRSNPSALAGLAISLLGSGDPAATATLELAMQADAGNSTLHASTAFHFIRSNEPYKALDSADRAIAADSTSVWGYIAKARAMKMLGDYDESERLLIFAASLGDLPSLNYELASLRLSLGYFREAAETIFRTYDLDGDLVISYLGNRVLADSESFADLVTLERRAAVSDPMHVSEKEIESGLKSLMAFVKALSAEKPELTAIKRTADGFIAGDDPMRLHREIFIAGRMLQRGVGIEHALSILRGAVSRVDVALKGPMVAPATLADDIYEARQSAFARGERIFTPKASEQVLSSVIRGRLEELTGFAFLLSGDTKQAIVRLRRAVSVLPEKSAWWNSAQWRLGNALEADGNAVDAVEAYLKTYDQSIPNLERYSEIERVWLSLERKTEELVARIGPKPSPQDGKKEPLEMTAENVVAESKNSTERKTLAEDVPFVTDRTAVEVKKDSVPTRPDAKKIESVDAATTETSPDESKVTEGTPAEKKAGEAEVKTTGEKEPLKSETDSVFDSIVISAPNKDEETRKTSVTPCRLIASPSLITLATDGTDTRIAVSSFGGDHRDVTANSLAPEDVEIKVDGTVDADANRKFFAAKSLSGKTGLFRISLTSPCGNRELEIRVK